VKTAIKYKIFPLSIKHDELKLAVKKTLDTNTLNDIQFILGTKISVEIFPENVIVQAIKEYYQVQDDRVFENSSNYSQKYGVSEANNNKRTTAKSTIASEDDNISVIQIINTIISKAVKTKASDIHFEPYEHLFRVRYRIDGRLYEMNQLPLDKKSAIISRLKIMADLDIAEKRRPQDGRIRINEGGSSIDIRLSTIPTNFGEKVVLRILDKTALNLDLKQLGFRSEELEIFTNAIEAPHGMILVTGPTGSGKTTSLYAALNYLNTNERNILTIEDPIEYDLPGINQSQVRSDIGYTFAKALRAFLRQDPNIVMVGEIRDLETAEIAVRAALTGHLVLSTLHTNDAPTAVSRLIDMGLEPFLIASSLRIVMAQRLVRKICHNCKKTEIPQNENEEKFNTGSAGCEQCNYTGYKGRTALFELMPVSQNISDLILKKSTANEIMQQAIKEGMKTLRQSGIEKVNIGMTTMEEVVRETTQ
jgi:type IV pilus assembly protein PilB